MQFVITGNYRNQQNTRNCLLPSQLRESKFPTQGNVQKNGFADEFEQNWSRVLQPVRLIRKNVITFFPKDAINLTLVSYH